MLRPHKASLLRQERSRHTYQEVMMLPRQLPPPARRSPQDFLHRQHRTVVRHVDDVLAQETHLFARREFFRAQAHPTLQAFSYVLPLASAIAPPRPHLSGSHFVGSVASLAWARVKRVAIRENLSAVRWTMSRGDLVILKIGCKTYIVIDFRDTLVSQPSKAMYKYSEGSGSDPDR